MSRRSKRSDAKSGNPAKPERGRPTRRPLAPLPEVMLARRPARSLAPPAPALAAPAAAPESRIDQPPQPAKRAVRIVKGAVAQGNGAEDRRHLLDRLLDSEGPGAVTRAANAYKEAGFEFPDEQPVQLKLLQHADEAEVCRALGVLATLLDEQAPIKLPVFEQRLKRLEDSAEDPETRVRAAELRRVLRT
jgi:hypothetical protein